MGDSSDFSFLESCLKDDLKSIETHLSSLREHDLTDRSNALEEIRKNLKSAKMNVRSLTMEMRLMSDSRKQESYKNLCSRYKDKIQVIEGEIDEVASNLLKPKESLGDEDQKPSKALEKEMVPKVDPNKERNNNKKWTLFNRKKKSPNGMSVHWLCNGLLKEVEEAGLSRDSNIYELKEPIIRKKGENVRCPRDRKIGAAYVDCLEGKDNVGPATFMLSYAWKYTIGDIVDVLYEYCRSHNYDEKRTYIWICFACNNQHRIEQQVPFDELQKIFHNQVTGIGHILCMLAPWDDPEYVKRVWCVFELYTANANENAVAEVVIPPRERERMVSTFAEDWTQLDKLYRVLAEMKVEIAESSVEEDRKNIMRLVEEGPGCESLNNEVNNFLRNWVKSSLMQHIEDQEEVIDDSSNAKFAYLCYNVANILTRNGEHDEALTLLNKAREISEKMTRNNDVKIEDIYDSIGTVLHMKGDNDNSLNAHTKADKIRNEKMFQRQILYGGQMNLAVDESDSPKKTKDLLAVEEASLGNPPGEKKVSALVTALQKSLDYEDINVFEGMTVEEGALQKFQSDLRSRYILTGIPEDSNDPDTAVLYNNIGVVQYQLNRFGESLCSLRKAYSIHHNLFGDLHSDSEKILTNIGEVLRGQKCDYDGALLMHQKARAIKKELGYDDSHPSVAKSLNNIASVLFQLGRCDEAIEMLEDSFAKKVKVFGEDHPSTIITKLNLDVVCTTNAVQAEIAISDVRDESCTVRSEGSVLDSMDFTNESRNLEDTKGERQEEPGNERDDQEETTHRTKIESARRWGRGPRARVYAKDVESDMGEIVYNWHLDPIYQLDTLQRLEVQEGSTRDIDPDMICADYHLDGQCYTKCKLASSHTPLSMDELISYREQVEEKDLGTNKPTWQPLVDRILCCW